jgi:hypothetical protein
VLSSEKARLQAMIDVDLDALDRMLADDCLYVHSTGEIDTMVGYLSKLADGVFDYRAITACEQSTGSPQT